MVKTRDEVVGHRPLWHLQEEAAFVAIVGDGALFQLHVDGGRRRRKLVIRPRLVDVPLQIVPEGRFDPILLHGWGRCFRLRVCLVATPLPLPGLLRLLPRRLGVPHVDASLGIVGHALHAPHALRALRALHALHALHALLLVVFHVFFFLEGRASRRRLGPTLRGALVLGAELAGKRVWVLRHALTPLCPWNHPLLAVRVALVDLSRFRNRLFLLSWTPDRVAKAGEDQHGVLVCRLCKRHAGAVQHATQRTHDLGSDRLGEVGPFQFIKLVDGREMVVDPTAHRGAALGQEVEFHVGGHGKLRVAGGDGVVKRQHAPKRHQRHDARRHSHVGVRHGCKNRRQNDAKPRKPNGALRRCVDLAGVGVEERREGL